MEKPVDMPAGGLRVLGLGVDEAIGVAAQDALRQAGLRASVITVTDDGPATSGCEPPCVPTLMTR